jgi:hypothetical protein
VTEREGGREKREREREREKKRERERKGGREKREICCAAKYVFFSDSRRATRS